MIFIGFTHIPNFTGILLVAFFMIYILPANVTSKITNVNLARYNIDIFFKLEFLFSTNLILKSNCITSLRIHNHWGIILWRLSDINLPFGPVFHCNTIFFIWQCQQLRTIQAAKNMTLNFWLWDI